MFSWLRQRLVKGIDAFVSRRLPKQSSVRLDQAKIFILPSRQGFLLLLVVLLLLLLAINFESSLNYALAFWLLAMLWVAVHLTYRNLSGLVVSGVTSDLVCVGDVAQLRVTLSSSKPVERGVIECLHPDWGVCRALMSGYQAEIILPVPARARGPVPLPRFRIESRYPFGLVVAWSYVLLAATAWAYPQAQQQQRLGSGGGRNDMEQTSEGMRGAGYEDFHSLQTYVPGDPLNRIHWPAFSRDQWLVKTFADFPVAEQMIDWQQFPGMVAEQRLAAIAFYSEHFCACDEPFGIRLPGHILEPARGREQLARVRQLLAGYGYD